MAQVIGIIETFDEWKKFCQEHLEAKCIPGDTLVYPDIVGQYISGYMTSPVCMSKNGLHALTAASRKGESIADVVGFVKEYAEQYEVYLYQVIKREVTVEGYTISDYILRFSTSPKE